MSAFPPNPRNVDPQPAEEAQHDRLSRFLGDRPARVLVRLVFLSFVVGLVMAALGLRPRDVFNEMTDLVEGIWNLGFGAVEQAIGYFLYGVVIVVPLFLLIRLLAYSRRG